jgi:Flp pilus assembly protein TadD
MKTHRAQSSSAAPATSNATATPFPRIGRPSAATSFSIFLVAITLVAFFPVRDNGFVNYDDQMYVTENPNVHAGLTRDSMSWALTTNYASNWHPLTWWSLQLDHELHGLNPTGFLATNVIMHAASVVLLFWVLRLSTGLVWPAAATAALFAIHPLRVESVAWVAERKDVLSTLLWMATLLAYVWYTQRPSPLRYLLVLAGFALGLMAKPMLVTLPFALLLLDYWPLSRLRWNNWRTPAAEKLPLVVLAAIACWLTISAQSAAGAVKPWEHFSADVRVGNALIAYASYLGLFVWPSGLAPFYPHPRLGLFSVQAIAAGVLLVGLTVLALRQSRARPYLIVGWLWYLGTLLPVIGLVQVGGQGMADRYTYIPMVGVTFAVVWAIFELAGRSSESRITALATGALILLVLLVGTRRQVSHWRDTEALWRRTLTVTVRNYEAHRNLGQTLERQGKLDEAHEQYRKALEDYPNKEVVHIDLGALQMRRGKFAEARQHFQAALDIDGKNPVTNSNMGALLLAQGRPVEAEPYLRKAIAARPDFASAHFNLALVLIATGRFDDGTAHFDFGRGLEPRNVAAHHRFAVALRDRGRFSEAELYLREILATDPASAECHHDLGILLEERGEIHQAVEHYRQCTRLRPREIHYRLALAHALWAAKDQWAAEAQYRDALAMDPEWPVRINEQAWRLAVHPDPKHRDGKQAVRLAEQVCQSTAFEQPDFLDTLAAAYAEVTRFQESASLAQRAIDRARAARNHAFANEVQSRLRMYEARQPFRAQILSARP